MSSSSGPPPSDPLLVTGATGNVGREVVRALVDAGVPVRAASTSVAGVQRALGAVDDLERQAISAAVLDFTDPTTWSAFDGVKRMFLVRPPHLGRPKRQMVPALEQARRAGVEHVVLLSLQGAERNKVVPHAALEEWLRGSGLSWTFVRPSFFMQNLTTTHLADIRDRGEIVVPAGHGATSFVDVVDVAAVAAAALLDPAAHTGRAWTPTGPEALTYDEVARTLTDVLGRPIRYTRPGVARWVGHAHSVLGMPLGMVAVTTAIYTVARLGRAAGLTDDVLAVTGREPVSLRRFAERERGVLSPA